MAASIKVKATLPSGEVKSLSFPPRVTVEQVKNKFFDLVPPRYRKEPYYIQVGNAVLDLEFYKLLDSHHTVKEHLESGNELEITFITQLDAKKLKQKGLVETVTPHALTVTKDLKEFVQAQKEKQAVIAQHTDPVAEEAKVDEDAKKAEEAAAAAKQKADEEAAAKKKKEEEAAAAATAEKQKADEAAAAKKKAEAAAADQAREEAAAKKKADETAAPSPIELSAKTVAASSESAAGAGLPASATEVQARIDENRKKFKEQEDADEEEHKKKLAAINAEWDAKLQELAAADKAEEEEVNAKVEELKKIGASS